MAKKQTWPTTRTKNPEPLMETTDWIIWAAWADRVTFEEIYEKTGLSEKDVILVMRRSLKRKSFLRRRKRVYSQSIKHRKRFQKKREVLKTWTTEDVYPYDAASRV